MSFTYYDFFCGGGMVQEGLGPAWRCVLANDNSAKKVSAYISNWGEDHIILDGVENISPEQFEERAADLSWASFPCQDLSLAGSRSGLKGARSGTFWAFWELMRKLIAEGRGPRIVALENVYGALRSHGGRDFVAIAEAFTDESYRFGAFVIDAEKFVPQSRPRLFVIAIHPDVAIDDSLLSDGPDLNWHPDAVFDALSQLDEKTRSHWLWFNLPEPVERKLRLIDLLEEDVSEDRFHSPEQTDRLLSMMTEHNLAKVEKAKKQVRKVVGGLYRRTRQGIQRAEVRFDDVAGCLRTPAGGSSRQTIVIVEGNRVRTRLLTPREAARLMGLSEQYKLPSNYNEAYHLAGDGVVADVVAHLSNHIFEPILKQSQKSRAAA